MLGFPHYQKMEISWGTNKCHKIVHPLTKLFHDGPLSCNNLHESNTW